MAEEKKNNRRGRKAYLNDFKSTVNGEYIYAGAHYLLAGGEAAGKALLRRLWLLTLPLAVGAVAGGCIRAPGAMDCFYVLGPYIAALISAISLVWALCRMGGGGARLREYVYRRSVEAIPSRAVITAVFAGLALAGEILYVLLNGTEGMALGMVLFLLSMGATLAAALGQRLLIVRSQWTVQDGQN